MSALRTIPKNWRVEEREGGKWFAVISDDMLGNYPIKVELGDYLDDECANLIAAAPDLYEALAPFASAYPGEQSPVSLDEPVVCEFTMRQLKAAAAAIAKAEGRT